MTVRKVLALRGPNLWARVPVLEVWIDVDENDPQGPEEKRVFADRLATLIAPVLTTTNGERESTLNTLRSETDLAPMLAVLVLELQRLSGSDVESIVLSAKRRAVTAGQTELSREHLEQSIASFIPSAQGLEKEMQVRLP